VGVFSEHSVHTHRHHNGNKTLFYLFPARLLTANTALCKLPFYITFRLWNVTYRAMQWPKLTCRIVNIVVVIAMYIAWFLQNYCSFDFGAFSVSKIQSQMLLIVHLIEKFSLID